MTVLTVTSTGASHMAHGALRAARVAAPAKASAATTQYPAKAPSAARALYPFAVHDARVPDGPLSSNSRTVFQNVAFAK
jgi:hypothetical protein